MTTIILMLLPVISAGTSIADLSFIDCRVEFSVQHDAKSLSVIADLTDLSISLLSVHYTTLNDKICAPFSRSLP